jgi:hypothetical protein
MSIVSFEKGTCLTSGSTSFLTTLGARIDSEYADST